jgi:predicted nucleic acid-binding protein
VSHFVVDASIAVKWFLPEIHGDAAVRLLGGDHSLVAPDLLFPEVGNVLWKPVRRREATVSEAQATLDALASLPIEVQGSPPLMPLAFEIAGHASRSVYDTLYLAVAVLRGCRLVTADRKLYAALAGGDLSQHLMWVTDLA